jgi:hypothetical protein
MGGKVLFPIFRRVIKEISTQRGMIGPHRRANARNLVLMFNAALPQMTWPIASLS